MRHAAFAEPPGAESGPTIRVVKAQGKDVVAGAQSSSEHAVSSPKLARLHLVTIMIPLLQKETPQLWQLTVQSLSGGKINLRHCIDRQCDSKEPF